MANICSFFKEEILSTVAQINIRNIEDIKPYNSKYINDFLHSIKKAALPLSKTAHKLKNPYAKIKHYF